jgi:hypothetical protein
MATQNGGRRHRRRMAAERGYRTPWILRDVYGAPVWGMLAVALVIIGVLVLYLSTR